MMLYAYSAIQVSPEDATNKKLYEDSYCWQTSQVFSSWGICVSYTSGGRGRSNRWGSARLQRCLDCAVRSRTASESPTWTEDSSSLLRPKTSRKREGHTFQTFSWTCNKVIMRHKAMRTVVVSNKLSGNMIPPCKSLTPEVHHPLHMSLRVEAPDMHVLPSYI